VPPPSGAKDQTVFKFSRSQYQESWNIISPESPDSDDRYFADWEIAATDFEHIATTPESDPWHPEDQPTDTVWASVKHLSGRAILSITYSDQHGISVSIDEELLKPKPVGEEVTTTSDLIANTTKKTKQKVEPQAPPIPAELQGKKLKGSAITGSRQNNKTDGGMWATSTKPQTGNPTFRGYTANTLKWSLARRFIGD